MSLVDMFWSGPPVTRTWAALIFVESVSATAGLLSPYYLYFNFDSLFQFPPQIWRLATSFAFTTQLSIIFLPYMVWNYAGWLERDNPRFANKPGSFLIYVLFVGLVSLIIGNLVWGTPFYTNMLVIGAVYTWSQENRGRPIQVYFVTINAKYLWVMMLAFTFLQSGLRATLVESTGAFAAHMYDFLTIYWPRHGNGNNYLVTPNFVAKWFDTGARTTVNVPGGTGFAPRSEQATATASGFSSWNSRGQGRRLGGE